MLRICVLEAESQLKWWLSGYCGQLFGSSFLLPTKARWAERLFLDERPWIRAINPMSVGVDGADSMLPATTHYPLTDPLDGAGKRKRRPSTIFLLLLESAMIGVLFRSTCSFFTFLRSVVVPFLSIGIWGGDNRFTQQSKFFIFTL